MKVEVKKIDPVRRELFFEVPKDRVSKVLNEVYEELGKSVKVKGFREGKVPRHIIESRYSKIAQEETIRKVIPEAYHEGIEKEKVSPLDMPEIHDVNFKDGVITFTAKLDIKPEVKIKDYKGIPIKRKETKVTDEEINKTLEMFQKGHGHDEHSHTEHEHPHGEHDHSHEVKIDDAFARGLGYPNLEEFKKFLAKQIELDKEKQSRLDLENQIVEALLKDAKLTLPQSIVKKQYDRRLAETMERFKKQGIPQEEIVKREEEIKKNLLEAVEKDVRVYLVLDKVAELENIHIHQGENLPAKVIEFLLKEAKWS